MGDFELPQGQGNDADGEKKEKSGSQMKAILVL